LQANFLNELFNISFLIENTEHSASISMGMVALKEYENDGIDALKDASIALKRTKGMQRGSSTLFTREMGVEIRERAQLMQHLHKAFAADRLF